MNSGTTGLWSAFLGSRFEYQPYSAQRYLRIVLRSITLDTCAAPSGGIGSHWAQVGNNTRIPVRYSLAKKVRLVSGRGTDIRRLRKNTRRRRYKEVRYFPIRPIRTNFRPILPGKTEENNISVHRLQYPKTQLRRSRYASPRLCS